VHPSSPTLSCQQIITGATPGPGQAHGCPFRHYSEANLTSSLLTTYGLNGSDTKDIVSAVKSNHYHLACTRLFEIQHAKLGVAKGEGIGKGDSVDHPNRYFDRSRALYKEQREKETSEDGKVKKEEPMEVDG
jgi:DNA primase large subunit